MDDEVRSSVEEWTPFREKLEEIVRLHQRGLIRHRGPYPDSPANNDLPEIRLSIVVSRYYYGDSSDGFFLVTPVLLALIYGYFLLQMQRVWGKLANLPAIFPDGESLDEKIYPWLVTGIVRVYIKRLRSTLPPFFKLQRVIVISLV